MFVNKFVFNRNFNYEMFICLIHMSKTMKMSRRKFCSLFFLMMFVFSGGPAKAQIDPITGFETDKIQKLLSENKIPALGIGVITDGKLAQVKVFGDLKPG